MDETHIIDFTLTKRFLPFSLRLLRTQEDYEVMEISYKNRGARSEES